MGVIASGATPILGFCHNDLHFSGTSNLPRSFAQKDYFNGH